MFPQNLDALYLQRQFTTAIQPIAGAVPPNSTFAGFENPLRHTLQTHAQAHRPADAQYRDWFGHVFGSAQIAALGTPVSRNWQFPAAAAHDFYRRLCGMTDEAISAGRYWTYTVEGMPHPAGWRVVAVSEQGLIIALQWHGVWCGWTAFFASDFRLDQPDNLNRRRAMLAVLTTMTRGLSARRGLLRLPTATDRVPVTNRHGTEARTNLSPADLELWGERNGYFERHLIR